VLESYIHKVVLVQHLEHGQPNIDYGHQHRQHVPRSARISKTAACLLRLLVYKLRKLFLCLLDSLVSRHNSSVLSVSVAVIPVILEKSKRLSKFANVFFDVLLQLFVALNSLVPLLNYIGYQVYF
jgi:hypothetical protein